MCQTPKEQEYHMISVDHIQVLRQIGGAKLEYLLVPQKMKELQNVMAFYMMKSASAMFTEVVHIPFKIVVLIDLFFVSILK